MAEVQPGVFSFRRQFDKTCYPLLGEEEDKPLFNNKSYKSSVGLAHSTSVSAMIDLCRNEKGRWHWPINGADVVFPGIYLGDETTALCTSVLKDLGVTAVLNAAQGDLEGWSVVNTKEFYYSGKGIQFLGVQAIDLNSFPLRDYFVQAADWIDNILKGGGVVLVHCVQGISRSATLVLAFLIIKKKMTLQQGIEMVKKKRSIAPNEGFMQQLIELNDKIHNLVCQK
eukprot:GFUD01090331.1.p1 GENE.GFUD01090331.1~~GFUD01090331.1.p1  ORF type:complete len:248 (-),score=69.56 GFUD01090331.1:182-859(-)